MILIGYGGHAFVICGILHAAGKKITGYCDVTEKEYNPFNLTYLGPENSHAGVEALKKYGCIIAVGNNGHRKKIYENLQQHDISLFNAIHPSAVIDTTATIAPHGVMISTGVAINPLATVETGVICNTGCIIEHECVVNAFAQIGPGAVLCGNVKVGAGTFVGANAVVRQGIIIGKNAMIGAGAVVVKNVPDGSTVMGIAAK